VPYNSKQIIRDNSQIPVPQYYNPTSDQFEVATGQGGALSTYDARIVKDSWSGTANIVKTFGSNCTYFEIKNDGVADITFSIGILNFTVKQGEAFGDSFSPFTSVTITATEPYRAFVKG
jgi:hypothetical protein